MISERERKLLAPILEEESPSGGEWALYCPYHGDSRRSASLNSETRLWNCFGCSRHGDLDGLLGDRKNWDTSKAQGWKKGGAPAEIITDGKVAGWNSSLMSNRARLEELMERKGLNLTTIENYEIGWDRDNNAYTIPVRDEHDEILNVRRYQFDVDDDRRKIWSVAGMGRPTLYPIDQLAAQSIVVCEGEWDALLAIQKGIPAITRTGGADTWHKDWSRKFTDKNVYVCHDADAKGQQGNQVVAAAVRRFARTVKIVELPYDIQKKHGKDLGDYFLEDEYTAKDFIQLARGGEEVKTKNAVSEKLKSGHGERNITVMESFNPHYVEQPLRMAVTITGKRVPSHLVPERGRLVCDEGAGKRCEGCEMQGVMAKDFYIDPQSPLILHMVDSPQAAVEQIISQDSNLPKCDRIGLEVDAARTVEEIYVRPSIEDTSPTDIEDQDFTHRRAYSTVTHDLSSNQTVEIVGTIRSNPRNSLNEFQAWAVEKPVSALDSFVMSPEVMARLEVFQEKQEPLKKLRAIADDMATHVTHIYGRQDLHVFMDIVFHSVLHVPFEEKIERGWIDGLVMGDTRTGKSEVAARLIELYGMGEMISCEAATYAGVVGGLDRVASGAWIVKWGAIPVNDRRVVVLDEVSGLQPEQIAQMSSIRSSGIAEMTKIQSERAMARTRLVWLANPRDSGMKDYTFGVSALQPLIGNPEDIARFDMVMGVFSSDVPASLINRDHFTGEDSLYTKEAYRELLQWAWTRKPHHVKLRGRFRQEVYAAAIRLDEIYEQQPPLLQGANARKKLVRIATAIAARTFSTDSTGEMLYVTPNHVLAAEQFLNDVYGHPRFGYSIVSQLHKQDDRASYRNVDEAVEYLRQEHGLLKYLRTNPTLDRRNMESVLNMSPERCGTIISDLWGYNAVRLEGRQLRLHEPVVDRIRSLEID